jgi:RHS repeat-associated protein
MIKSIRHTLLPVDPLMRWPLYRSAVFHYSLSPYGETKIFNASGTDITATGSAISNTYFFQGRHLDSESGLYYFRNRYYSPDLGRFISKDPIGYAAGDINLYRFVGNGPYGGLDPMGLAKLGKDYGVLDTDGKIILGITDGFHTIENDAPNHVKVSQSGEFCEKDCKQKEPVVKLYGQVTFTIKVVKNKPYVTPLGYKFSDGSTMTQELVGKTILHESGHVCINAFFHNKQRVRNILLYVCNSDKQKQFDKWLKANQAQVFQEFVDKQMKAQDAFHHRVGDDGFEDESTTQKYLSW